MCKIKNKENCIMKNPFYVPGLTESVEQELKAKKEKLDERYITITGAVKKTYVTTDRGVQRVKKVDDRQSIQIPVWEKYALTIKEASEYYGISESKLRDFLMLNIKQPFVLKGGARLLVKRKLFEEFLDGKTII